MIRIGLDTMGADFSPKSEVGGALQILQEAADRLQIVLFGDKTLLSRELPSPTVPGISIVHCEEVITMDDEPVLALKHKRNSSLVRGLEALKLGEIDAFVSAGNTGAVMSCATLELGRIKGVSRPMIGSQFPRAGGGFTFVFDVGATVDAKPHWLKEYGIMGSIYAREIFGVANPTVALLSVGEEETKGNELVLEAAKLLRETSVHFIGNVEGRDVLGGKADVILCDGYTGNVILKFAESVLTALRTRIRMYADGGIINKLKAAVTASVLRSAMKDFDYQEYGGVPLLGVNGVVIIGHGSSSAKAIKMMIVRAEEMVRKNVVAITKTAMAS